ncbi:MAG: Protein of unknown function (DUF1553)/Protein of unknown function (DUF1549)/Planctomycete [Planctomycetaceae bacterium]|nr:Protein of unknown function (DUF1553)/Protein of unknown function (DUF1549)/Planctomycete [Planctomycetaceae bacterium]
MLRVSLAVIVVSAALSMSHASDQTTVAPLTPAQSEFFEQKIRPVLVKHCYECHSAEAKGLNQLKAGLMLDSRQGLLVGGDSGAAVVPKKPEESLLLEALRYDTFKMPPKGKLPDAVIADFETWIKHGALDPRDGKGPVKTAGIDLVAGRTHWAYRPVLPVPPPAVKRADWALDSVDRYILQKLEARNLEPAADADKTTLIRRIYFDLIGLPPTLDQIDAFVNDSSPNAYPRIVDQLLASPQFGERWGRHWLDVVRYGESLTLRGFILPEAWRYRDYVIQSFNADRPYNQFLVEQVAGDLIPANPATDTLAEQQRRFVATTFLMLGNTNLEEQDKVQLRMDVVDEQLDVISKGFLAQTITCARCHDHKFDPIPTRDYYALAGILRNAKSLEHANVSKWLEFPLPVEPALNDLLKQHETAIAAVSEKIKLAREAIRGLASNGTGSAENFIVGPQSLPGVTVDDIQAKRVGEWKHSQFSKRYIGDGYLHDLDKDKGQKTLTFQPDQLKAGMYEVRLAYLSGSNRSPAVPVTVFSADGEKTITVNQQIDPPLEGRFISLGKYRFEQSGQGFVIVANEGTKGHVVADAVQFLPLDMVDTSANAPVLKKPGAASTPETLDKQRLLELAGLKKPGILSAAEILAKQRVVEIADLEKQLQALKASGPRRPMFMSVQEEKVIDDCPVHIRGTVHNLGEKVPRGFLQVASWSANPAFSSGQSGRMELGAWLADRQNPLTPRVMVNRIWHWLLGSGIVRTVDNFGTTGEAPSDPELLDHLAADFVSHEWSIKAVVRKIVLSRTYRLSSVASPDMERDDPENRLFGRSRRRRLDSECLLDSMLSVSGQIDFQAGGAGIRPGTDSDFSYEVLTTRRAVYWPVLRNSLPEILTAFDFPDPSMVGGQRNVSTVASQALFLMNSQFVRQQSQMTARRLLREPQLDLDGQIELAFRLVLGRLPSHSERVQSVKYVSIANLESEQQKLERWSRFVQALFGTLDFRYVD